MDIDVTLLRHRCATFDRDPLRCAVARLGETPCRWWQGARNSSHCRKDTAAAPVRSYRPQPPWSAELQPSGTVMPTNASYAPNRTLWLLAGSVHNVTAGFERIERHTTHRSCAVRAAEALSLARPLVDSVNLRTARSCTGPASRRCGEGSGRTHACLLSGSSGAPSQDTTSVCTRSKRATSSCSSAAVRAGL